ncbi:MAG: hypothetical protein ACLPXT_11360 [Terracidiphilus sp.]
MEDKIIPGTSSSDENALLEIEGKAVPEPIAMQENDSTVPTRHLQSLLDARGIGADLANGEDTDDYIRQLREGWE